MRYQVLSIKYDMEVKDCVEYVVGEFNDLADASIFKNAYNEVYHSESHIVEKCEEE